MWWGAWLWTESRARALLLPVISLQLAYIISGSPKHSMTWHVLTAYMYASTGTYGFLRLRDWVRRRRAAGQR